MALKRDIAEIKEQLGKVTEKLTKLDLLEEKIQTIEERLVKIDNLEEQIIQLDKTVQGVTNSQNFISKQYEDQRKTIDNVLNQNKDLKIKNEELTQQVIMTNSSFQKLEDEINNFGAIRSKNNVRIIWDTHNKKRKY